MPHLHVLQTSINPALTSEDILLSLNQNSSPNPNLNPNPNLLKLRVNPNLLQLIRTTRQDSGEQEFPILPEEGPQFFSREVL
jgi:hypothetical protein